MKRIASILLGTLILITFMFAHFSMAQEITITDLGSLDGTNSEAFDINNLGQVTGSSHNINNENHAFFWSEETGMQGLGTLGGTFSAGYDINNLGQVAGDSNDISFNKRAFFWSEETGMLDLGTLGGTFSSATAINDLGQVVGQGQIVSGVYHAFFWSEETGMQDLGTLDGTNSYATAINDLGQVTGISKDINNYNHAFLWSEETGMQDLGNLGGNDSWAMAINELGHVAGRSRTETGAIHAFLWTPEEGMQDLGSLGGNVNSVRALNEVDQVVGNSSLTATLGDHAFVAQPGEEMRDLGTLGGTTCTAAFDINNFGHVVGINGTLPWDAFFWSEETGMQDLGNLHGGNSATYAINDFNQIVGYGLIGDAHYPHAILWTVELTPSPPQEQIDSIIGDVSSLIDIASFNSGQGNSLISKLDVAKKQLDKENEKAACNLLQAFINQIEAFMKGSEPMLTEAEGQPLIDAVNILISELCG